MSVDPIDRLILELARLPTIGRRTATRLTFYLIRNAKASRGSKRSLAEDLAEALHQMVDKVGLCRDCHNLCAAERCSVCTDQRRDRTVLCVVSTVQDLRAIETSGAFRGLYHVLHGSLSPLEGVGPEDLEIAHLKERAAGGEFQEVILATNADVEGDATALYVATLLREKGLRLTRLASGIPLGGELEYVDEATLGRALAQRREF